MAQECLHVSPDVAQAQRQAPANAPKEPRGGRARAGPSEAGSLAVQALEESAGDPLDAGTRLRMQERFGHDFSRVRIHSDPATAQAAEGIGAVAYGWDHHVGFAQGRYAPGTSAGQALLAHELAHVVQRGWGGSGPGGGSGHVPVSNPGDAQEVEARRAASSVAAGRPVAVAAAAPRAVHRQEAGAEAAPAAPRELDREDPWAEDEAALPGLRDRLLEALERADATAFLTRLRGLTVYQGLLLEMDAAFLEAVRGRLGRGFSYWIVLLQLHFGGLRRADQRVRELHLAAGTRDARRVLDLLRSFPDLLDPARVPGVRDMLDVHFRGHESHAAILAVAGEREEARTTRDTAYREVHYETPEGGGQARLEVMTGRAAYELARTPTEVRVVVRIRFVERANPARDAYPLGDGGEDQREVWRQGIEERWNNRFVLVNPTTRLPVVFVPMFTADNPHFTVAVDGSPGYVRSNQTMWWRGEGGRTAAHEFGHMVGNPDEYNLPADAAEAQAGAQADGATLSTTEQNASSFQGVTGEARPQRTGGHSVQSLMGRGEHRAALRHAWSVQGWFNMHLLRPGEEGFFARLR